MAQGANLNRYIIKFSIAYIIGLVALTVVFYFFEFSLNSGMSAAILLGAAMYAAGTFVEENKRVPTKIEKSKLVWLSLVISWTISITLSMVFLLIMGGMEVLIELLYLGGEQNIVILIGALLFVSLLYFLALSWCYGGFAKKQYEALLKKGKI